MQFAGLLWAVLGLLFYRWYDFTEPFYWRMLGVSIMTFGFLLLPQLLYPILLFWFLIGKIIGDFVSSILLWLLYFLFIWVAKLFVKVDLKSGWKEKTGEQDYKNMG